MFKTVHQQMCTVLVEQYVGIYGYTKLMYVYVHINMYMYMYIYVYVHM